MKLNINGRIDEAYNVTKNYFYGGCDGDTLLIIHICVLTTALLIGFVTAYAIKLVKTKL
jgi:hypothetical protein